VRDQQIRTKEPEVGVDIEMLEKWATDRYVEHLLKKKENAGMVGNSDHMNSKAGVDGLFQASQAKQPFALGSSMGAKNKPKETGIKIHVGAPVKKEEKTTEQSED
jgi:hypothetical protein